MNSITLGRYLPLDSFIHRRDPRVKIVSMIFLMVAIFMPTGFLGYGILAGILLITLWLAKLNLIFIWKAIKPMAVMMLFLLVINVLVLRTGDLLLTVGPLKIYSDAIFQSLYIAIRLILMIVITTLLTATTKPLDLTLGIEDLLSPLKVFKVPAHEIAMIISIALRFIPTLIEEANRIMKAQASRGVDLEEGSFKEKIAAILSLIVPLFVTSIQSAEDLGNAMEARGYIPSAERTRYKQLHIKAADIVMLVVALVIMVGYIVWSVYL